MYGKPVAFRLEVVQLEQHTSFDACVDPVVKVQASCLVIDDAPGVWHHPIVIISKSMVASSWSPKAVAYDLCSVQLRFLQLFANVIGC